MDFGLTVTIIYAMWASRRIKVRPMVSATSQECDFPLAPVKEKTTLALDSPEVHLKSTH
jgi:hypothetical protein